MGAPGRGLTPTYIGSSGYTPRQRTGFLEELAQLMGAKAAGLMLLGLAIFAALLVVAVIRNRRRITASAVNAAVHGLAGLIMAKRKAQARVSGLIQRATDKADGASVRRPSLLDAG